MFERPLLLSLLQWCFFWLKQKSDNVPRPWLHSKGSPPWRQWLLEERARLSSWSSSETSRTPWCPKRMKDNSLQNHQLTRCSCYECASVSVMLQFFFWPILKEVCTIFRAYLWFTRLSTWRCLSWRLEANHVDRTPKVNPILTSVVTTYEGWGYAR